MRNSLSWAPRAVVLVVLSVFSFSDFAFGRMRWAERDGHAVLLHPRRFGQEHPAVIDQISAACDNGVCATLGGGAITPLLAEQPECTQQDFADKIINTSRQFDAATQAKLISLAKLYRQAEKNTPPDFTTNPPTNRNSVFCQKAPQNPELNGLFQAQDPANKPNVFFDPALQKSVLKGSQPNTEPFKGPFKGTAALSATTKAATSGNQNTTSGNKDASDKKGVVCAANRTTSGSPPSTSSPPPKIDSSLATSNNSKTTNNGNLQTFTDALGGVTAPAVIALGNGQFQVENNASFKSLQNALRRSCDVQHNKCADAANASGNKGDLTVAACGTQQTQCDAKVAA